MGSFQQITMGIICLVAAFWFGTYLQDRPAGQNQTAALLPDGTIDPNASTAHPNLLEKTKGFLSSMFESPAKPKPITVDDLRSRSQSQMPNVPPLNLHADHHTRNTHAGVPANDLVNENLLRLTADSRKHTDSNRFVGTFQSDGTAVQDLPSQPAAPKVAIVPDFSSLAEEVNRGLSFNDRLPSQRAEATDGIDLIPAPRFSDIVASKTQPFAAETDWDSVRKKVAAAESRLNHYREQMKQPIPEIVDSVAKNTEKFWDRQQSEARRQPSRLASAERLDVAQQRRLKLESWSDKQKRWDVFSKDRRATPKDRQQDSAVYTRPKTQPSIVEVDRGFDSESNSDWVSQLPQPPVHALARVRSLNDDRGGRVATSPFVVTEDQRGGLRQAEVQNQLRPHYNPDAGSKPEFVSPPDFSQFQPKPDDSPSEIVEAATVTYGSFREYKTRPEDTLQTISQAFYGSADYYFDLYLANRDLLSNPATVPAGLTIKIPKFDGK